MNRDINKQFYKDLSELSGDAIIKRKICPLSGEEFPIYEGDIAMSKKCSPEIGEETFLLPEFTYAPGIRKRLKTLWKNERVLYHVTCGLTGEKTVSRIAPETGVTVYKNEAWAGEGYTRDAREFGIDRQSGGTVMEKMYQLAWKTPYQNMIGSLTNIENNAIYTNYTADVVDCYMCFDAHTLNNCYHVTKSRRCADCVDCKNITDCERCYECVDSIDLHTCRWVNESSQCNNSRYLDSCVSCDFCFGCVGLEHKKYHIFNKAVAKDEYESFMNEFLVGGQDINTYPEWKHLLENKEEKQGLFINSERCGGLNISNSKEVFQGYTIEGCENLRWCSDMSDAQDCIDVESYGHKSFLMANSAQVGRFSHHICCSATVGRGEYLLYCIDVKRSKHCFGCVNMKNKEYCIFNKQYTKEAYEIIVPQLISQMKEEGTRGAFFDPSMSVFPYNDTLAYDRYPLEEVRTVAGELLESNPEGRGVVIVSSLEEFLSPATLSFGGEESVAILWRTQTREVNIPESVAVIRGDQLAGKEDEEIVSSVIRCSESGRPYRFVNKEIILLRALGVSLSPYHHDVRFRKR